MTETMGVEETPSPRRPILISRKEAAERINISGHLLDRATEEGLLTMVRIGSRKFYRDTEIDEFVKGKQ